jgi:FMN-dependent oxidoreductase (nitrilotriacetate monooxygenase family)
MMHLLLFMMQTGGHIAGWRLPSSVVGRGTDLTYATEIARTAERGKFDAVFIADAQGFRKVEGKSVFARTPTMSIDPIVLLSALAAQTDRIGLIGTASTSYNEPFALARRFAALDHVSGGRAGWNIVTSTTESEAHNFGRDAHFGHEERYHRAAEFVDVVTKLWDSWEDGAVLADKASGRYIDPDKLHGVGHQGEHFKVSGPMTAPRTPQGYPVLVQAGASDTGKKFAADVAEVIFTSHPTIATAQAFYAEMQALTAASGRAPGGQKILPAMTPIVGSTEAEAKALQRQMDDLIDPELSVSILQLLLGGIDLSGLPLDGPLPPLPPTQMSQSVLARVEAMARTENLTIRETAKRVAAGRTSRTVVGSPEQVADELQAWYEGKAADGFVVAPANMPDGLEAFVDHVVPILQARGLYRRDYEGVTLREHLGLAIPANRYTLDPSLGVEPEIW